MQRQNEFGDELGNPPELNPILVRENGSYGNRHRTILFRSYNQIHDDQQNLNNNNQQNQNQPNLNNNQQNQNQNQNQQINNQQNQNQNQPNQ